MFSVGFFELCIIAVVALVFIGPQKLPELMQQAGRFFVQARRMSNEMRSTVDTVIHDAEKSIRQEDIERQNQINRAQLAENPELTNTEEPRHIATRTQRDSQSVASENDPTYTSEHATGTSRFPSA